MKYAFIIGSNAFVVPSRVVSYADNEEEKEFLRINSIYHDLPPTAGESHLEIDLDIKDLDGTPVLMLANLTLNGAPYTVKKERDSIQVLRADGSLIIHVHQLDDDAAMSLEHNITAELEVNTPIAVIRINGDFMTGKLHISAENEKLFVNNNSYANSVLAGNNQLKFTADGVEL
ncbi:MAG TPA: hypothetical protein VIM16_01315 [Mucilaginibacter sp.]|jgi:hypothetical protein